ncbi:MAG: HPr family phosphocarrier protein [Deltaproteobacteria bacterium]|nr:HPr family phosphocarrier protein [Deltaproteobacteria bacterium]
MKEENLKTLKIVNTLGLHARAAATFVKLANRFESEIFVTKGKNRINGKSIMGLLMLAAGKGTKITIEAIGPDAAVALAKLEKLVTNGFNEK